MFPDFPQAHEELGNALLAQNNPDKAIESFRKAIEWVNDSLDFLINVINREKNKRLKSDKL